MGKIHSTAVIDTHAEIADGVDIGPYAVIGAHVRIEAHCCIHPHVVIDGHTTIDSGSEIWPGAVIGSKTQDLKFRGETTFVHIGKNCQIRECVTINSSCGEGSIVKVGESCLIMAYSHVAHNCEVGHHVILANNATLAGHVIVEDYAIIGGLSAIHQFSRVGRHAMVGGMSRVTRDIPPYTIGAGSPYKFGGINLVGLKRHGMGLDVRRALAKAFTILYRSGLPLVESLDRIEAELGSIEQVHQLITFCRSSQRGLIMDKRSGQASDDE